MKKQLSSDSESASSSANELSSRKSSSRFHLTLHSAKAITVPHPIGALAVDGWAVAFGTAKTRLGRAAARPACIPNVTVQLSTASVPICCCAVLVCLLKG